MSLKGAAPAPMNKVFPLLPPTQEPSVGYVRR